MTAVQTQTSPASSADRAFRCTILYDDFVCGVRAKEFAHALAGKYGAEDAELALWRCEMLALPDIALAAERDATSSDFVIFSLRGNEPMSPATNRWLESWSRAVEVESPGIVALFDPARSLAAPMDAARTSLRAAAARAQIDFFASCPAGNTTYLPAGRLEDHEDETLALRD